VAVGFGKYTLQRKLAEGGMAELFLARQEEAGQARLVVIKRILPHLGGDPAFVKLFVHEARVASRLDHPNIVRIYELGRVQSCYFIAMEYVHGVDLRRIAQQLDGRQLRLPIEHAARVLASACEALDYAHRATDSRGAPLGLVHRDVSPHNLLISFQGEVKLVDFGIARATALAAESLTDLMRGKYAYMSPEQCRGEPIDGRTDVWAAGVLLWELLTWRRLFKRPAEVATLRAVVEEPIPGPRELCPEVPVELDHICRRALARELGERYPDARTMQTDLEMCIRRQGWDAGDGSLGGLMRELFAEELARPQETLADASAASPMDPLCSVDDESVLGWMHAQRPVGGRVDDDRRGKPQVGWSGRLLVLVGVALVLVALALVSWRLLAAHRPAHGPLNLNETMGRDCQTGMAARSVDRRGYSRTGLALSAALPSLM
jgi:serine/threonine-protein kinase